MENTEVKYIISTYPSKFAGYQSKKGPKGIIKTYIYHPLYWNSADFSSFVLNLIHIILIERICLERAFNKIKIKGGMCNPCCVNKVADKIMEYLNI